MKRYLVLLLCIPLLSALVFNTFVAADEAKTLKVGIYDNQPKIFMDNAGQASGFWPDIINYIAAAEGWKIKYIYGTWSDCLQRLEKNEIDIMPDVAYTADREQIYAFSHESVYTSWSRIYTRKGSGIYSILDLEGKKLAVLKGSINVDGPDGIKELIHFYDVNCTLIETESYLSVLSMVQNREADAGVTSKDFGYKNEGDFKVIRTAILLQPSLLYFAFPKNSSLTPYLIETIDNYIIGLKQDNDSIYYRSLDKWMGVKQEDKEVIPAWLTWSLACIAGLALLLAGGSFLLRRQVIHRTQALTAEIIYREQAEEDLQKTLNDTVLAMAKILEMKDPYTSGHQVRVAELATAIAAKLNFSDEQIKYINTSAIIHDIGKMHIPSDILSKPGQLSDLEYKIIQTHAQGGYEILKGIEFPAPVAQTVLQHHERIDGSGYPHGLKGEDILLEARILAVADVVEAMSSYRPYRAALGVERALAEIKAKRGVLYDEKVVDACLELFNVDKFSFSTDA